MLLLLLLLAFVVRARACVDARAGAGVGLLAALFKSAQSIVFGLSDAPEQVGGSASLLVGQSATSSVRSPAAESSGAG